ncbi:hypothetical protein ACLOJK_038040 [Asimina triloba]
MSISLQREMEMETEEKSNLCEDMVVEILCRLPSKSLARFKCVSKQWLTLMSDRNRVSPKTTRLGLVCQSFFYPSKDMDKKRSRMVFFHVDLKGKGSAYLDCSDLGSSIIEQQHHGRLLCSCNGFLLFINYQNPDDRMCMVWHPATKRSWHIFPPKDQHTACVGLASDGSHFNVACIVMMMLIAILGHGYFHLKIKNGGGNPRHILLSFLDEHTVADQRGQFLLQVSCIGFGHLTFSSAAWQMDIVNSSTCPESPAVVPVYREFPAIVSVY